MITLMFIHNLLDLSKRDENNTLQEYRTVSYIAGFTKK